MTGLVWEREGRVLAVETAYRALSLHLEWQVTASYKQGCLWGFSTNALKNHLFLWAGGPGLNPCDKAGVAPALLFSPNL